MRALPLSLIVACVLLALVGTDCKPKPCPAGKFCDGDGNVLGGPVDSPAPALEPQQGRSSPNTPAGSLLETVGERGYLYYPTKNVLPVFPVKGDYDAFSAAVEAKTGKENELIWRSKLVDGGTMIILLGLDGAAAKVRVLEGKFSSTEGYTFRSAVRKTKP